MSGEVQARGVVCYFCGKGWGCAGETPDAATFKAACDHEAECPRNPYKAAIASLAVMVDVFAGCIETGTLPARGSPCHRKVKELLRKYGVRVRRGFSAPTLDAVASRMIDVAADVKGGIPNTMNGNGEG